MFNAITWENFFTTVLLVVGGYYFITSVLLYHSEISNWFKSKVQPASPPLTAPGTANNDIVGPAAPEENRQTRKSSFVSAEDVLVTAGTSEEFPDTIQTPGESELLTGTVEDLMEEIKTLLELAHEYQSSKEECAALFTSLFERYSHLKGTAYESAVNRHVHEEGKSKFSFDVQLLEVRSWWQVSTNK